MRNVEYIDNTKWNKIIMKNIEITVERGYGDRKSMNSIEETITYSLAHENKQNKGKCGLCKLYFDKKTMQHRVPNHRIIELQKLWNCNIEGRRYESASFLYTATAICTFCYQLFDDVDDDIYSKGNFDLDSSSMNQSQNLSISSNQLVAFRPDSRASTAKAADFNKTTASSAMQMQHYDNINPETGANSVTVKGTTEIQRTNVSVNKIAYQSSTVDKLDACLAVTEPYFRNAKTRREVDPWWEVNFERLTHIHSLKFMICASMQTDLTVVVFLLNQPEGFKDPFLDSMKVGAKVWKEFTLPATKEQSSLVEVSWELPAESVGMAVRLQLMGIHALTLKKVQVFQGNNVMTAADALNNSSTIDLFETVPPSVIRDGLYAMLSGSKKRNMIEMKAMASKLIINANNKFSLSMPEAKLIGGVAEKLKKMPEVVKESSDHVS